MNRSSISQESESLLLSEESAVSPAVKAWLKNVLVPAIVKQYIAAHSVTGETASGDPTPE